MKTYSCKDAPLKVFGIPFFEEKKRFERLPEEMMERFPHLEHLGKRCPGARVGFKTNAAEFTVKVALKTLNIDIGMSIYACQAVSVMIGERTNSRFAGIAYPPDYHTKTFEKTFTKSAEMEEVTLWLLRNEELESVEVSFPDDAIVEAPAPYQHGPALYYGSSITEGGCCCNVTNGYNALLSRWLDLDYYNMGFSGNAKGEPEMADYLNTIDFSLFVLDYDHNAPTAEHLEQTHEPFFKRIREKHPDVPILLLTRPDFKGTEDDIRRRTAVKQTYDHAVATGDTNVYFIDGETYFSEKERQLCLIDGTHPNDLGFYRMAERILPVMKEMIEKAE